MFSHMLFGRMEKQTSRRETFVNVLHCVVFITLCMQILPPSTPNGISRDALFILFLCVDHTFVDNLHVQTVM